MTHIDYVCYNEDGSVSIHTKGCGCCASYDDYSSIAKAEPELKEYMDGLFEELLETANALQISLDEFIASKVKRDESEQSED